MLYALKLYLAYHFKRIWPESSLADMESLVDEVIRKQAPTPDEARRLTDFYDPNFPIELHPGRKTEIK